MHPPSPVRTEPGAPWFATSPSPRRPRLWPVSAPGVWLGRVAPHGSRRGRWPPAPADATPARGGCGSRGPGVCNMPLPAVAAQRPPGAWVRRGAVVCNMRVWVLGAAPAGAFNATPTGSEFGAVGQMVYRVSTPATAARGANLEDASSSRSTRRRGPRTRGEGPGEECIPAPPAPSPGGWERGWV
ncbi:hypothetical protein Pyrfu_0537 [Pyrolobus fumarii 1A]|uniref:Uncharacterized protein n=1 Tax=Pyrolobus fumarii (strain DSM 11204 / 1A) TaxID=694429 RepID=G0EGN4_PYRF1|nr:hypothetical protein Pyrfu_0537 [Pyrolobus fumarii 1A]